MPRCRWVLVSALAVLIPVAIQAQARAATWAIDTNHCVGEFSVRHMMLSNIRGQIFCKQGGTVTTQGESLVPTAAKGSLDVTTLDTRNERRDGDLKNNYFKTSQFPTMSFESTKITPGTGPKFSMAGNLTINGITKPVTFEGEVLGNIVDGQGRKHAAYSAHTVIDRREFGMDNLTPIPTGGLVVGTDVDITLQLEAIAQ